MISEDYKVPDRSVGLIIGRGGETLHKIVAETNCKLNIAHDSGGLPERIVTLVGTKDSIERAKRAIDDVLRRTPGHGPAGGGGGGDNYHQNGRGGGNFEVYEMKVPGNKCGLVIGKGGETIKRLSEQFNVKLVVVQETNVPPGSDKPLRITGDPDSVIQAKEAILALIAPRERGEYGSGGGGGGGGRYGDRYGGSEVLIKVPGDKAGIVIGKGGESIKDINRRSGAHVEIDKNQRSADGNDKMFVIKGTPEQIQLAQQLIYEKITGNQGSQIPSGYFNQNDMNAYGGQRSGSAGPNGSGYGGAGAYGAAAGAYGQAYNQQQQWYGQGAADPNMSAAWQAYYQQYYQAGMQPAAGAGAGGAAAAPMPATGNGNAGSGAPAGSGAGGAGGPGGAAVQPSINPQTGQPDYSQAWIEYYRSLGMHEQADAILRQTQQQQPSQLI